MANTAKRLAPCTLCLHDIFLFFFPACLKRAFGFNETLLLRRHFSNVSHVSLVSDSSHTYLMWLHNSCQGDLGPVESEESLEMKVGLCKCLMSSPGGLILSLASRNTCFWWKHSVCHTLNLMFTVALYFFFLQGFDECVLTWSLNGADSEPHWPLTMGLQNIRRERLQEGHNRLKGTCQQPPCCWTSSHLI